MSTDDRRLEPRRRPRQVRAELTRGRILAAAAHVFADEGYAAATTNRIAAQAQVSIGSLYQYYPNKDAIFAQLLLEHIGEKTTIDAERLEQLLVLPLEEVMRQIVRQTVVNHRGDPRLLRIMVEDGPRSQDLKQKLAVYAETQVSRVLELLQRHPQVRTADARTAAHVLVTTVELVVHTLMSAPEAVSAERLEAELVTMLTRYLSVSSP